MKLASKLYVSPKFMTSEIVLIYLIINSFLNKVVKSYLNQEGILFMQTGKEGPKFPISTG
jgi:hypothetical protein